MNLNDYKIILVSGCSYGRFVDGIFEPFLIQNRDLGHEKANIEYKKLGIKTHIETDNKLLFVSVSKDSQSSDWIADSLIYTVDKLLELGADSKNIYCYIEWTQIDRISIHTMDWLRLDDKLKWVDNGDIFVNIYSDGFVDNEIRKSLENSIKREIDIKSNNNAYNIGYIQGRVYLNSLHMDLHQDDSYLESFIEYGRKYEEQIPIEEKINRYFNNLLLVQSYLKEKQIKYNYVFMQGSLTNWNVSSDGFFTRPFYWLYAYNDKSDSVRVNNQYKPTKNEYSDIEYVVNFIEPKFNLLDFDNIWFFENENYRRGGIDEWAIEKFGRCSMTTPDIVSSCLDQKIPDDFQIRNELLGFDNHPNINLYKSLWNETAFNCDFFKLNEGFIKKVEEFYWEDVHSDLITKHGITFSDKFLYGKISYI